MRSGWRLALVFTVLALGVIAGVVFVRQLALPVVDDAAISIAYGMSLWEGYGPRLTHASPFVEGFTSPAWALIAGFGPAVLKLNPLTFAQAAGIGLGTLGCVLLGLLIPLRARRPVTFSDLLPLTALGMPSLGFWLSSGMETGLQVLALALGVLLMSSQRGPGLVGAGLGALILVRPEFVIVGAGLLAVWGLERLKQWRALLVAGVAFGAVTAAFFLGRYLTFAEWLPNTWFVKRQWDFNGPNYLKGFIDVHAPLLVAAVLALLALALCRAWRWVGVLLVVFGGAVHFAFVSKGDWMREWRFLVHVLPFVGFALSLALSELSQQTGASWVSRALLVASGLALTGGLVQQVRRHAQVKAAPEFPAQFVMDQASRLKQQLDGLGIKRAHLGLPDVGGLALVFREGEVSDVAGLADYSMAHAPGTRAMEDYLAHEGPPDIIDAHGPSGHVALPKVKAWYPGWSFGIAVLPGLTADEDPRCPGKKKLLLDGGPQAQQRELTAFLQAGQPIEALRLFRCARRYLADDALLERDARRALAEDALQRGENAEPELKLRYLSLATLLADDPRLRRRTEALRAELFPGKAAP